MHEGDQNLIGGARLFFDEQIFLAMQSEIKEAFQAGDIPQVIRLIGSHFENHHNSFWHLLKDKKRDILNRILETTLAEAEASLRQIIENHYPVMSVLKENEIPLPKAFATSVEFILNADFRRAMEGEDLDLGELRKIVQEFIKWDLQPDNVLFRYLSSSRLNKMMTKLQEDPIDPIMLKKIQDLLRLLKELPVDLDLWKSQNIYFGLCKKLKDEMGKKREQGESPAEDWIGLMKEIGRELHVACW